VLALVVALLATIVASFAAVGAVARSVIETFPQTCSIETATVRPLGETSYVYAVDDRFLGAIRAEIYRQAVPLEDVSPWVVEATIAMEDRRFWEHDGIDLQGVVRAAWRNLEEGQVVEGGSTITQQLARSLYLTPEQTLVRKRDEACLALGLEREWSKQRILEAYLNRVYYGNRVYGIQAAAQVYFNRRASELGPAQAALITGLIQAPSAYDPFGNPERALERRNEVLLAMHETGALPAQAYEDAVALPLNLRRGHLFDTQREPYFFEFVRQQLVEAYGEETVRRGGLRVYTTVNPRYQVLARQAINEELGGSGDPASAIVSIDPRTGAIRAMTSVVPGTQPDFNIAAQARRQSGSAFKPFVLAEAMRQGANPHTTIYDSALFTYQPSPGAEPWSPKTYDGSTYGPSTLTEAMIRSDNLVYAKLTLDLGPGPVARMAHDLGITTQLERVPSMGLGANDVRVLDMASAYATFASGGVYRPPFAIREVRRADGTVDEERWGPSPGERVLPDYVAYEMTQVLEQNVLRGTGTRARLSRPAAGKTGTTDDYTDAWFVGYVPQLATAAWVGYPNRTASMTNVRGVRVAGGTFPAAIWGRYMEPATGSQPPFPWVQPLSSPTWQSWNRPWSGARAAAGDDGDNGD
jgi:penicillin-binding protein 1A